jgi:hypothetical protein
MLSVIMDLRMMTGIPTTSSLEIAMTTDYRVCGVRDILEILCDEGMIEDYTWPECDWVQDRGEWFPTGYILDCLGISMP